MAENLAGCPGLTEGQDVIMPIERPIKPSGHIQVGGPHMLYKGLWKKNSFCIYLVEHTRLNGQT